MKGFNYWRGGIIMRMLHFLCFMVLFLCLSLFLAAEEEVSIVKNDAVPLLGNLNLDIKEETIFDCSKLGSEYNIYYIKDIILDSDENILILAGNHILKFDISGKLFHTLKLKKGQGPGEVQQFASKMYRDSMDNIYIKDGFRLVLFDKNMSFKRNIHIGMFDSLSIDDKGFFYAFKTSFSELGREKVLAKFDKNGKQFKEFSSYNLGKVARKGGITVVRSHEYSPATYFIHDSDNHLIYAVNLEYKLYKYDREGNLLSTIIVNEKPQRISSKEKDEITKKLRKQETSTLDFNLDFPAHRPFFRGLLSDEKGRIYVIRLKSIHDEDKSEVIDIFSKDGRYLYKTKLQYMPKIIRNGSIYFVDYSNKDEYGSPIPKIKRLIIQNYKSIQF